MTLIKSKIKKAIADEQLERAVLRASILSTEKRDEQISELSNFETARDTAREIRQNSIDHLDRYLEQFTSKFKIAGGYVHQALTPIDANRIIIDILRRHKADYNTAVRSPYLTGVKSKSMVSEEIGLGHALKNAGIDAVESDLGEYIVQLAGEPPSHITAPALHRSRQSIGKLFVKHLGIEYTEDPTELTMIARGILRERFINAEFGISGANFLIAETGHIAIVENEGNVRLGLSLPPLYIAVTGIDKVIEKLDDIEPLLKLLPRSATGQRTTGYFHLLKPGRDEEDGPKEMHLVLIDNGRRDTLRDPVMREMLLCIRCGACLNICPVYRSVGGHAYNSVYPGPMGLVLSNLLGPNPTQHSELPHLSTLCGSCRDVCPVRIDIPRLLLDLRSHCQKPVYQHIFAKGWEWTMGSPQRIGIAGKLVRFTGKVLPGGLPDGWLKESKGSFRDKFRHNTR